jgi:hypothetical protein
MQSVPLQSANDRSRWCTVWSLVERGTYVIDEIRRRPGWDTIDLVRHEGHFYSTKPPIFPTLVAGLCWLIKHGLGWTLDAGLTATSRLVLLIVNLLPMTIAMAVLLAIIRRHAEREFTRRYLAVVALFGTLLNPFLTTLNNHTPAAACVIFAVGSAWPILLPGGSGGPWRWMSAGFWGAAACCLELPAAALGLALFLSLSRVDLWRTCARFVPAAIIPLAAFFVTNQLAMGDWKPIYLAYGTDKYEFIHEGVPSYWLSPRGVDRSLDSPALYLLHCTVGHHGVFSLSPVFLLTLGSWLNCGRWRRCDYRVWLWLGLGLTVVVFGFFLLKTENYNYGGVSVGLRWLLWLVPFWLVSMIPIVDRLQARGWRGLSLVCLGVSVFSAWYPLDGPWRQPWLYTVLERNGWIDYSDPAPPKQPAFYAWMRQLPQTDSDEPVSDYWIEFRGRDVAGASITLRLADGGGQTLDGRRLRFIDVTGLPGAPAVTVRLAIDVARFEAGAPVHEVLVRHEPEGSGVSRTQALQFVHGLPRSRAYASGTMRYHRSVLRTEAFYCQRASSLVLVEGPDGAAVSRRDLWLTDDIPYGVLEFESTVTDARTGTVQARQLLRAAAAGNVRPFDPERLRSVIAVPPR